MFILFTWFRKSNTNILSGFFFNEHLVASYICHWVIFAHIMWHKKRWEGKWDMKDTWALDEYDEKNIGLVLTGCRLKEVWCSISNLHQPYCWFNCSSQCARWIISGCGKVCVILFCPCHLERANQCTLLSWGIFLEHEFLQCGTSKCLFKPYWADLQSKTSGISLVGGSPLSFCSIHPSYFIPSKPRQSPHPFLSPAKQRIQ